MRLGLERRLEKVAKRMAARAPKWDFELAAYEARVKLGYLYYMMQVEAGLEPEKLFIYGPYGWASGERAP